MNFFKSVFSDDPDPPESNPVSQTPKNALENVNQNDPNPGSSPTDHRSDPDPNSDAGGWNFGGLIRTLTIKSESIIETYRRDLKEFGLGLKKEIEVAQGSLETVGHAIDEFGNTVVKGTAQIISKGKDAIISANIESDSDNNSNQRYRSEMSLNSKRYSRFDSQLRSIQGDAGTYCDEPEDLNDFNNWKLGFSLEGKSEEIESFLRENDAMESIYKSVVPNIVDHEIFWYRYYYRVYKFKKAEDVRARLVRRMSREEEELTWDFEDEDDDDKENDGKAKTDLMTNREGGIEDLGNGVDAKLQTGSSANDSEVGARTSIVERVHSLGKNESKGENGDNLLQNKERGKETDKSVEESKFDNSVHDGSKGSIKEAGKEKVSNLEGKTAVNSNGSAAEASVKVTMERKPGDSESSEKDNSSVVSTQHSAPEEEDIGWDEIEDLSSIDEKKESQVDLRKRLSAAEEEEDLSWDIEDDDKPA